MIQIWPGSQRELAVCRARKMIRWTMIRFLQPGCLGTCGSAQWLALAMWVVCAGSAAARPANCGDTDDLEWGKPVGSQAISISTPQEAYAPGQPIVLRLNIRNVGKVLVDFTKKYTLDENRISVQLPNGKPAPLTLYGTERFSRSHSNGTSGRHLKPNQVACDDIELSRLFDFSLEGTYTVSVEREDFEVKDGQVSQQGKVSSNRLRISVDGANPPNAKPGVRAVSVEVEGTRISMWMPRRSTLGRPVPVSISVRNRSNKAIYFDERACPPDARMKLQRLDDASQPEVQMVPNAKEKLEGKSQVGPPLLRASMIYRQEVNVHGPSI